jgi:hypothetical protein
MLRSDEFQGQFPKKFVISVAEAKNSVVFAFTYVLESFAPFIWGFQHGFIFVLTAMKR